VIRHLFEYRMRRARVPRLGRIGARGGIGARGA